MDNLDKLFMDKQTVNFEEFNEEENSNCSAEDEFNDIDKKTRKNTFKDTVTVQCIICILVIITVIVSNITVKSNLMPYIHKYKVEVNQDTANDDYLIKIYKILQR